MRKFVLAGVAAAIFIAPATAMAQSPIIIKFSHVVANDTPKGKGALKFKELAEKYTDGKVKVEVYPNSSLYKDKEEIEALQLGSVQMLAPSTAKFAPLGAKEFEALDLPWLFKDEETYAKADRYFRDVGSIPQIMAFSEVYQALQTGVVDGCENTPSNYLTQKFYEVQKDITVSYHAHLQYAVIVNSKFWNGLPPDIRKQLDKAMDEATDYTNSIAVKENEDALAEVKKSGKTTLHYLTEDQRKAWQTAMAPSYTWAKSRVGQEVLDLLAKELDIKMN